MEEQLVRKILHDVAEHMKTVMVNREITFSQDTDGLDVILEYMNVSGKKVVSKPRKVVYSKELQKNISDKGF